jgi:molybdenum cofactor cytidylyltransferase
LHAGATLRTVSVMSFGVTILAAGASSRMGRPKMVLPWGATTVLGHLLGQWQQAGAGQVVVVCAKADSAITTELDRLGVPISQRIINPEPNRGMFSSIQCSAAWGGWLRTLQHIAFVLGDQPHLSSATTLAIAEFASTNPDAICQPSRANRPRHPVFFPRKIFGLIPGSSHSTLKEFLAEHASERKLIEINDPGLDFDIDTPEDYENAKKRFQQ